MWRIIVCDGDELERNSLVELARQCLVENQIDAQIIGCADWPELEGMVKQTPPDVVIVAQDGVDGINTITNARLLSRKIIWFSDLDFGVQAYLLCVMSFNKKPILYQKMEQALLHFMEKR